MADQPPVGRRKVANMRLHRSRVAAIAAIAVLALGTGAALATTDVTINACVGVSSGSVRIVSDPTTCKSNEYALSWNQTGPQGPQGPQGPAGVASLEVVSTTQQLSGATPSVMATCPSGKVALSGGAQIDVSFAG